MIDGLPILGICGWSGSGKTTLIERLLGRLRAAGLAVAVVKHDAHGIDVDTPGKDSDRFFRAGADVLLDGPGEQLLRRHAADDYRLAAILADLAGRYDLVLVEGHKTTPLPKVWLLGEGETHPPESVANVLAAIAWDADRPAAVGDIVDGLLAERLTGTPVRGCVLIGGKSTRMGTPKHLLTAAGRTWLARAAELLAGACESVVIAGAGDVPDELAGCVRLADAPDARGPMAGVLAAMRWAPRASWLVAACDLPHLSADALRWLLAQRRPGVWATVPKSPGSDGVEPLLACYDFRARNLLEALAAEGEYSLSALAGQAKVASPNVPAELAAAWTNVNTPSDLPRCDPDGPA